MPWWAWTLLVWAVVAAACGLWWGRALSNAEVQDAARRITDESRSDRTDVFDGAAPAPDPSVPPSVIP